jgi:hypothetical protein
MEIIFVIAAVVAILGFAINLIGWDRVRQSLPWVEKEGALCGYSPLQAVPGG